VFREGGAPSACGVNSGFDDYDDLVFAVTPATGTQLVTNGGFTSSTSQWKFFELPDIVASVTDGVLQFYKANSTTTPSGQAAAYQETGMALPAAAPLTASFDIGNSSDVRKRVSVLLVDADFSDLAMCTYWLAPHAPLRTYQVKARTTRPWSDAAIYFYAATPGSDGGAYLLDNVSLTYDTTGVSSETMCVDPTTPAAAGGAAGANLIVNGDFSADLAPWVTLFDLTSHVANGVFEFVRPGTPNVPAGLVMQSTGQTMAANQILTATFQLGNSSAVPKRVTVLIHDLDLTSNPDFAACTYWLVPGQPLSTYTMRGFTSRAWANATLSIYAATVDSDGWTRLDNVTLARTPGVAIAGTECGEPAVLGATAVPAGAPALRRAPATGDIAGAATGGATGNQLAAVLAGSSGQAGFVQDGTFWRAETMASGRLVLRWLGTVDLTDATSASLQFDSLLSPDGSTGIVEVSTDGGVTWETAGNATPGAEWSTSVIDLGAWSGRDLTLRFVFDAVAPDGAASSWTIGDVVVTIVRSDASRSTPIKK